MRVQKDKILVERHGIPREISDEAARWVADQDAGLLGKAEEAELQRWLTENPLHRQAYERANTLWSALDAITETDGMRPQRMGTPPRRRAARWLSRGTRPSHRRKVVAAAAACAALLLLSVSIDLPMRIQADAMTPTGRQQLVMLPDGSSVRLNTASAIAFDYGANARRIRLLRGEAEFSVQPDPDRPFTVEAADGSARALGTRFIVREHGDAARVTVTEHRVLITYEDQQRELREGESLAYNAGGGIGSPQKIDIADAEAWTRGRLVVVNQPLAEVVAELGRYYPGYIYVRPSAASLRVSGSFRTDRPLDALKKIQDAVGINSLHLTNKLIFLYK